MNEILKQNKTAFYVFDVKTLKDRVAYLRKMLPEDVAICYAIKANTFITAELEMMLTALKSAHRVRLKSAIYLTFPTK